jgi:hypothetical protein
MTVAAERGTGWLGASRARARHALRMDFERQGR